MTITQLECFLAIARVRHFRRAADNLGKTQPALSVQIQRLEADLGISLFERSGRQLRLTSAGEILIPYAERILVDVEESRIKMDEVKGGSSGVVRIGVLPTVAAHFLPPVLGLFKTGSAGVTVILREESRTPLLIPLVQSGEIDLFIGLRPLLSAGLKSTELLTEELCVAVSRKHALARKKSVSLSRLKKEKFILYKGPIHSTRELALQFCRNAGFEPEIAFESEQAETIQNLVAANLGVTILPHMVVEHRTATDLVMLRIQAPAPRRTLVASWRPGRYLTPPACRFLECAEKVGRQWERAQTASQSR
jgi:DNA-binding transcriptional LysR family regulator